MRPWTFPVSLSLESSKPLFLQISQAISDDIQRGRLKPGAELPGSRTLAQNLGVHRNTILAAFRELMAEGWIESLGRTTRVVPDLPVTAPKLAHNADRPGFSLIPPPPAWTAWPTAGELAFGGMPDLSMFPSRDLGQALRRALRQDALLDYGDVRGDDLLREGLAALLSEMRGLASSPDQILVTAGSQMALYLITRVLISPGDRVIVENPGYPSAWATFSDAGASVVPVAVDAEGLRVDQVELLAQRDPIRAIFVTPHHQYPTTATMSAARRLKLLECAARNGIAIIEDDYDFEFHFEGHPVMPLASRDSKGVVIYIGTLSKVLAPGLRLGFVAAPQALIEALACRRRGLDCHGNQIVEHAVGDLLAEGLLQRHIRKLKRIYASRREALGQALHDHLDGVLSFELPSGGMSIWAQAKPEVDVEAWLSRAKREGISYSPGRIFEFHGNPLQGIRLGFSRKDERGLKQAIRVLASTL